MTLGLDHHRLLELARTGEGVIRVGSRTSPTYILNHPDFVHHVLIEHRQNYDKNTFLNRVVLHAMTGSSLITTNGEEWERQRQASHRLLAAPSIGEFADVLGAELDRLTERWDGLGAGGRIPTLAEMSRLALRIMGRLIFRTDLTGMEDQVMTGQDTIVERMRPSSRSFKDAVNQIRVVADHILVRAERDPGPVAAWAAERRRESAGVAGFDLTGETLALLVASYETTGIALAWTWMLLAQNRDARARLEDEVDRALGDAPPRTEHLPQLSYARAVIDESMRLYPPAWSLLRRAIEDDEIGGVRIPAGSMVAMYPFTMHRREEFWERPDAFEPERFLPGREVDRPAFAYFPFGAGPRVCVGRRLALMELPLLLAGISRRWRLNMEPGQLVESEARINLRPKGDFQTTLERRSGQP